MLSIIVWIVKTCDEDVMLKWVRSEDSDIIASLCLLLRLAVQVFAYAGTFLLEFILSQSTILCSSYTRFFFFEFFDRLQRCCVFVSDAVCMCCF